MNKPPTSHDKIVAGLHARLNNTGMSDTAGMMARSR